MAERAVSTGSGTCYSTPAAEAVSGKSGLTITDFLRPLSLVNKLNGAPARQQTPMYCSSNITSELDICAAFAVPNARWRDLYRIQEIKLALYAGNTIFQPKPQAPPTALQRCNETTTATTVGTRETTPQT